MSGAISKSPKWRFSIFCGGRARPVSVVAESCALECGDRYVWRDGDGNWIAEVLAVAVMGDVSVAAPVVDPVAEFIAAETWGPWISTAEVRSAVESDLHKDFMDMILRDLADGFGIPVEFLLREDLIRKSDISTALKGGVV